MDPLLAAAHPGGGALDVTSFAAQVRLYCVARQCDDSVCFLSAPLAVLTTRFVCT